MSVGCCTSCGAPAPNPIQGPPNTAPIRPGPRPGSSLVRDPNFRPTLTPFRETDLHTALTRGLAEYLSQLSIEIGGRQLRLTTYSTWAEPEQNVAYPSAGVGAGRGEYDRSFTPSVAASFDSARLMAFSEFAQELNVELWASDPRERAYLVAMIEEGLNPVDWMYGMRLVLPHYHGTTATYELTASQYTDNAEDAMARYRKALFTIRGSVTAYRALTFPDAKPRLDLSVIDPVMVSPDPIAPRV